MPVGAGPFRSIGDTWRSLSSEPKRRMDGESSESNLFIMGYFNRICSMKNPPKTRVVQRLPSEKLWSPVEVAVMEMGTKLRSHRSSRLIPSAALRKVCSDGSDGTTRSTRPIWFKEVKYRPSSNISNSKWIRQVLPRSLKSFPRSRNCGSCCSPFPGRKNSWKWKVLEVDVETAT